AGSARSSRRATDRTSSEILARWWQEFAAGASVRLARASPAKGTGVAQGCMLRVGRRWIGLGALALGLVATSAGAERLLAPAEPLTTAGSGPALTGVARVRGLVLGRSALADLRGRTRTMVADFPLGT